MANQWLRLWHDMPTDPKWRTIAKVSKQRIGDVIAVFTHLLVCASNATERGRTQSFNCEDVASALDIETEQVEAIIAAMQDRVLDGDRLKGWEIRQVSREDGSAERAKAWREAKKSEKRTQTNADELKQTPDTDTDKDTEKKKKIRAPRFDFLSALLNNGVDHGLAEDYIATRKAKKCVQTETAFRGIVKEADKAGLSLPEALSICCKRGWGGFEASWITKDRASAYSAPSAVSFGSAL